MRSGIDDGNAHAFGLELSKRAGTAPAGGHDLVIDQPDLAAALGLNCPNKVGVGDLRQRMARREATDTIATWANRLLAPSAWRSP